MRLHYVQLARAVHLIGMPRLEAKWHTVESTGVDFIVDSELKESQIIFSVMIDIWTEIIRIKMEIWFRLLWIAQQQQLNVMEFECVKAEQSTHIVVEV